MAVSVMTEVSISFAVTPRETAAAVNIHTPSTPDGFGFGTTTNGCRPISVNTQPARLPETAAAKLATARRVHHGLFGKRCLRVSHSTAAAPAADTAPNPIINRNPQ